MPLAWVVLLGACSAGSSVFAPETLPASDVAPSVAPQKTAPGNIVHQEPANGRYAMAAS
ncbi:MAG: hypothetical protein ACT443_05575 [Gemmatimonadota bacterium]